MSRWTATSSTKSLTILSRSSGQLSPQKQRDLSIFDGKIRGKAQSTRGFFLAANGFDNNAVDKFSGDAPRIVLMTGEDLAVVLDGTLPFFDLMKAKVDAIVRYGNINFPARDARGFR